MSSAGPIAHVAASERRLTARLRELWDYRHLVGNLVVRDLKVRYKGSILGFLWSMVSPLMMMMVFWFLFSFLWQNGIPNFYVFVLIGVLSWNWFSLSVNAGLGSIVRNAQLINKVYFPREVLPLSMVLGELVNFALALPVLFGLILVSGIPLTRYALWLPAIIVVQLLFALGIVLLLATANVYYRDVGMIMEVVLLAWFFLSPVFYSYSLFRWNLLEIGPFTISAERLAYIVNPMGTLIANYRTVLYGSVVYAPDGSLLGATPPGPPNLLFLVRTLLTGLVALGLGYWWFSRHAGRFGEEV